MKKSGKSKRKQNEVWRRLKKNKVAIVSLFVIAIVFLVAVFAPLLAPYPYEETHKRNSLEGSSAEFLLGTDRLGRDVLSRLIYGARPSLQMGIFAVTGATIIGVFIGAIAGYYGGFTDNLLMRLLDVFQGIPMFLLTITIAAVLGPSLRNGIIAIGVSIAPGFARLMRASMLTVREMEYVEAAKSINASNPRIIYRHIIPNAIAPIIVSYTMNMGLAVLSGSMLSFVGLGVQAPTPEWGAMIYDARSFMRAQPQLALYPGICVVITVLAFNMLGDGLRDALDPRLKN